MKRIRALEPRNKTGGFLNLPKNLVFFKRYKWAKIRKRRNQKKIPTPKTEVGKTKLVI